MIKTWRLVVAIGMGLSAGCEYPFEAELNSGDSGRLVVDGYIDVSADAVTFITLSRTTSINEEVYFKPEQGATVSIDDEDGNSYPLLEATPGNYQSAVLNLSQSRPYSLRIISNGRTYRSEFTEPIITPEIDSVTWKESSTGVQIHVTTHDSNRKVKYFQWNYEEVWERTVPYYSFFKYQNGKFLPRTADEIQDLKTCWVYTTSSEVNVKSSESYSDGIIPLNPVMFIPKFDERLYIRYSILVRQHALSQTGFRYYEILKKNGSLGTFSDPMPSELPGNLYTVGSTEPIVGYVGVYTSQTKRIEILESQLTHDWIIPPACEEVKMTVEGFAILNKVYTPTIALFKIGSVDADTTWAVQTPCADCRPNGGTNLKPSFWD